MSHDWAGRIWARTFCVGSDYGGTFSCPIGDCGTGRVECNGALGAPPVTLVEFTLSGANGKDYYDINLRGGFNLPVQVTACGGDNCGIVGCPVDISNHGCPDELKVHDSNGGVIACKSGCTAFSQPEYCCTGDHSTPDKCRPDQYSRIFKNLCPQAFTYMYEDNSTFLCDSGSDYLIVFFP